MFLVQAGACAAVHSWAAMFVLAGSSRVNVCRRDVTAERNHRKTSHINAKFLANTPPRRHALFVFQVVMFRCYLLQLMQLAYFGNVMWAFGRLGISILRSKGFRGKDQDARLCVVFICMKRSSFKQQSACNPVSCYSQHPPQTRNPEIFMYPTPQAEPLELGFRKVLEVAVPLQPETIAPKHLTRNPNP